MIWSETLRRGWLLLVLAATARLLWLTTSYLNGATDVRRHHVESAALLFAGLLLVHTLADRRVGAAAMDARRGVRARWAGVLLAAATLALYGRALMIGLLSDDFVLRRWAIEGDLTPHAWTFVRPLPIALWAAFARVLAGDEFAFAVHALNVMLHVVNALFVHALARALGMTPFAAGLGALLFVSFPAHVETVTWPSGIFDVLLVTLVLALGQLALRRTRLSPASIAAVVVFVVAGLATKETFVVAPVLVAGMLLAVDAPRSAYWPVVISGLLVVPYMVWRVATLDNAGPLSGEMSGYVAKEILTRPFAALTVPFHTVVLSEYRLMATLAVAAVILVVTACVVRRETGASRRALAFAAWPLVAVLPIGATMHVTPDLEGSRYLYLPAVGWSLLLAQGLDRLRFAVLKATTALVLVVAWCVAATEHLNVWLEAGAVRDRTLAAVRDAGTCDALAVITIPDTHEGAYVFRNGLSEALDDAYRTDPRRRRQLAECGVGAARRAVQ